MSPDKSLDLSIILSSHNGARTLERMLDSLCQLDTKGLTWELILVDNSSSDNTSAIASTYAGRLPMTLAHHAERGKNKALNAHLGRARGQLFLFTDDDVIFDPVAATVLIAAAEAQPDFDIFGGAILPHWEREPADWLLRSVPLGVTFGLTSTDLTDGPVNPGLVWGAVMAVRRSVFDTGLRFNEAVGPAAGQYVMGSETEFNLRAARLGHRAYHVAAAKVEHIIRPEQLELAWILRRAERFGKNMYWQHWAGKEIDESLLFGVPRWRLRRYVQHWIKERFWRFAGSPGLWLPNAWEVAFLRGYISQARQLRNQQRNT